jgi:hypothetical protein
MLRFRFRWLCRLKDESGSIHTYIDIDNMNLVVPFTVTTTDLPSATANAAGSLGLNSLGQYLALRLIGLPYVMCRVIVAVLVGVCWNFPLHRRFVFSGGVRDQGAGPAMVP